MHGHWDFPYQLFQVAFPKVCFLPSMIVVALPFTLRLFFGNQITHPCLGEDINECPGLICHGCSCRVQFCHLTSSIINKLNNTDINSLYL